MIRKTPFSAPIPSQNLSVFSHTLPQFNSSPSSYSHYKTIRNGTGTLVSREGESSGSGLKKGRGRPAALAWQAARHKRRSDAGAGSFPSNIWFRHHRRMLSGRVVRQHLSTSKTLLKNSTVLCRIRPGKSPHPRHWLRPSLTRRNTGAERPG